MSRVVPLPETLVSFWGPSLIADEVFVVGRNQQELTLSEAACAAIVGQIKFPALPLLNVDGIAQERNSLATVADVQA